MSGIETNEANIIGPNIQVEPDVPPNHSAASGFTPAQAAEADRVAAEATVERLSTDAAGTTPAPTAPDRAPSTVMAEDIHPETEYGDRGEPYVGIAAAEDRQVGHLAPPDIDAPDLGFLAGRMHAAPVPEHERLEPGEPLESEEPDESEHPGIVERIRHALFD